jgi:hypothetical protein
MNQLDTSIQEPDFKDRKIGLVIFGILHLGMGTLSALMVPLMVIGMIASKGVSSATAAQTSPRMMIPGILVYVVFAVWFIWLGIGSIMARRWARALILTTSLMWLVCGIGGLATMIFIMPDMYRQMGATGQIPAGVANIIMYVTMGFMAVLYILIPAILALFYRSPHVKATCEVYNPDQSWTDACPLPVLALSLLLGFWALCMPTMGFYGWALPLFGVILTGPAGATAALTIAIIMAIIARGIYKLDNRAWTGALAVTVLWALSIAITFSRVSLMEFYEKMDFQEEQLELLRPFCESSHSVMIAMGAIWLLIFLGYLLYTKRFIPATSLHKISDTGEDHLG